MKAKIVINIPTTCHKCRTGAMQAAAATSGVNSVALEGEDKNKMVVIGEGVNAEVLTKSVRKKVKNATLELVEQL